MFVCDSYSRIGSGTPIIEFDLLVGLEPCGETEHIIRQSLKYDKPFDVLLCANPHIALDGRGFDEVEDWYKHLRSISYDIDIAEVDNNYIATNCLAVQELTLDK